MLDAIVTNVLLPGAFIGLLVVVPLWWVLRGAAADRPLPDDPPADPSPMLIRTAAVLSPFGPFWYSAHIRPRTRVATDPETADAHPAEPRPAEPRQQGGVPA